ncbi:uncharacterized protein ACNLHF_008270 isoform 1-T1 [Anomaloglossus baeobatrachus]|uniref:uncharacterized protein LOC142290666 n=1 Tax=Anomaloglossus baeobatrachus TaxID=238106 RepID=UPI003F4FFE61
MDFKAQELSWRSKATNIFQQGVSLDFSNSHTTEKENLIKYKNLTHKKMKIWWTKVSMENYLLSKIVPRGLRFQTHPTFPLQDEDLTKRWIEASLTCSNEFMKIIIDKNAILLKTLDTELEVLQQAMTRDIEGTILKDFFASLDKDIEKWETEISQLKGKKYQRDMADFEMKRIFRWQIPKKNDKALTRNASMSSAASTSEGELSSFEVETWDKRHMRTRNGDKAKNQPKIYHHDGFTRDDQLKEKYMAPKKNRKHYQL